MHIERLQLTNFRNYIELEFDVPHGISIFQGDNAQGKTNLLEAICFMATTRLSRSVPDKELINWDMMQQKIPFSRLSASINRSDREVLLEIVLQPRSAQYQSSSFPIPIQKHIRVNGVARRAFDLVGQLNMVMFSPRDIDLIGGEPALRRRHLDITNSQVDPQYLRKLQRYNKVLGQRNHLLRQIAMHHGHPDELVFWDNELVQLGAWIVFQRQQTIASISELSKPIHDQLSGGKEVLALHYQPNLESATSNLASLDDIEQAFNEELTAAREKELIRGQTSVGPHRDELRFLINNVDMGTYGSRGQQRTTALSIKLAEAKFMLTQTEEPPVLLLDDVLSELDRERREHILEAVSSYQQVLMTTTDLDRFPSDFLAQAERFEVKNGAIHPGDS
jgi:DNA replication and repair protein RecF